MGHYEHPAILSIATLNPVARRPGLEESLTLAERMGDKQGMARALFNLTLDVLSAGDPATALTLIERSVLLAYNLGSRQDIGRAHMARGYVRLHLGQYEPGSSRSSTSDRVWPGDPLQLGDLKQLPVATRGRRRVWAIGRPSTHPHSLRPRVNPRGCSWR